MKLRKPILALIMLSALILALSLYSAKKRAVWGIFCYPDIGTYKAPQDSLEVNSGTILGEEFISNFNNLFMITVFIPTQDLNSDEVLIFSLKGEGPDKRDRVSITKKFSQIRYKENDFYLVPPDRESTGKGFHYAFFFPPIKESKGKKFYFSLAAPGATAGKGLKVGVWDKEVYYEGLKQGSLFINHKPSLGHLAFRAYNSWQGNPAVLMKEITARLKSDMRFFLFYSATLSIVLASAIALSIGKNKQKGA